MATDQNFVDYILDQLSDLSDIRSKKMFGEYALYFREKVFAFVCDNQLFIKPTKVGKTYIGEVNEAPPYPGAKMYYLVEDQIEDKQWLCDLVRIMWDELPAPKVKRS